MKKLEKVTKEEIVTLLQEGKLLIEIAEKYQVSDETLKNYIRKDLQLDYREFFEYRSKYNIHLFDVIDRSDKAYWLGFLYADGNVRSGSINNTINIQLDIKDEDHLIKFKTFMEDKRGDSVIKYRNRLSALGNSQTLVSYSVCNKHLKETLIDLGCTPRKSLTLSFPDITKFKKPELVYDFIRGYIDGDGCYCFSKEGTWSVSLRGTPEFLTGVMEYLPQFKKIYKEIDKRTGNCLYKLACSSRPAIVAVIEQLYKDKDNSIYLTRKFNKIAGLLSDE